MRFVALHIPLILGVMCYIYHYLHNFKFILCLTTTHWPDRLMF